jgi:hypothetical protein
MTPPRACSRMWWWTGGCSHRTTSGPAPPRATPDPHCHWASPPDPHRQCPSPAACLRRCVWRCRHGCCRRRRPRTNGTWAPASGPTAKRPSPRVLSRGRCSRHTHHSCRFHDGRRATLRVTRPNDQRSSPEFPGALFPVHREGGRAQGELRCQGLQEALRARSSWIGTARAWRKRDSMARQHAICNLAARRTVAA